MMMMYMMAIGMAPQLMILANNGNELVNYIDTDTYWNMRGVAVSVDAMQQQMEKSDLPRKEEATEQANPPAGESNSMESMINMIFQEALRKPKAESINRLLAIKTLGKLKEREAIPVLESLLESKKPFVASCAKRAIAEIEDKKYVPVPTNVEQCSRDLNLLPPDCGVAGQIIFSPGDPDVKAHLRKTVKETMGMYHENYEADPDIQNELNEQITEMIQYFTVNLVSIAATAGNMRIDSATFGLSQDMDPRKKKGWAVAVLRGKYDSKAAFAGLKDMTGNASRPSEMDCLITSDGFAILFPSDELCAIVFTPSVKSIGDFVKNVAKIIASGKGGLVADSTLCKLLAKPEPGIQLRLAVDINDHYRKFPFLEGLESLTLTMQKAEKENTQTLAVKCTGSDADAVGKLTGVLQKIVGNLQNPPRQDDPTVIMPGIGAKIQELAKSIKIRHNGKEMTLALSWKNDDAMSIYMLLGRIIDQTISTRPEDRFEEIAPADEQPAAVQ